MCRYVHVLDASREVHYTAGQGVVVQLSTDD